MPTICSPTYPLYPLVSIRVQGCCSLIQDEDAGVAQEGACEAQQLSLSLADVLSWGFNCRWGNVDIYSHGNHMSCALRYFCRSLHNSLGSLPSSTILVSRPSAMSDTASLQSAISRAVHSSSSVLFPEMSRFCLNGVNIKGWLKLRAKRQKVEVKLDKKP